jgi:hypothetical protein
MVAKKRMIGLDGHVAYTRKVRSAYSMVVGKPEGRTDLSDRKDDNVCMGFNNRVWTGFIWLRIGSSGELLCTR